MPLVPAKCPQCGAQLKINSEQDAAICEYCNTPFIVDKAITNFNITNNFEGANITITTSDVTSAEKLLVLAKQALQDKNYINAYNYYNEVLLREPENIEAYFYSHYCGIYSNLDNMPGSEINIFSNVVSNTISKIFYSSMEKNAKINFTVEVNNACQQLRVDYSRVVSLQEKQFNIKIDPDKKIDLLVLKMADALYDCYPTDKFFQSIYVPIWKEFVENTSDSKLEDKYEKKIREIEKDYSNPNNKKIMILILVPVILIIIGFISVFVFDVNSRIWVGIFSLIAIFCYFYDRKSK